MMRSCKEKSCSYPGMPARRAVQLTLDSVLCGNMENDQIGVRRGHSSPMQDEGLNSKKENGSASSEATKNPTEGVSERRIVDQPDSDVNLLEQILCRDNMLKAWERVKSNKGTADIDEMPVATFMAFAHKHWQVG